MKCILDSSGWCARHKHRHTGSILDLSQRETEEGETARMLWDMEPSVMGYSPPTGKFLVPKEAYQSGFGSVVKRALGLFGFTEQRVSEWIGGPCGCKERAEKWNALIWWAGKAVIGQAGKAELEEIMGRNKP
jgi:hypothetical protein